MVGWWDGGMVWNQRRGSTWMGRSNEASRGSRVGASSVSVVSAQLVLLQPHPSITPLHTGVSCSLSLQ